MEDRHGITIPFDEPLHAQRPIVAELADLGYTDMWSSEADGTDGFTPLVLASQWVPEVRLGIAIVPAFTHAPALLSQQVASICEAAPGRFAMGIGSSSNVIVERWNGVPFERPYERTRDTVRFLKRALTGERVAEDYETFSIDGFTLRRPPPQQPPILVAALRDGMLRMAGREGDGAIINWLSATDVATVVPHVRAGAEQAGRDGDDVEIVARVFVCPNPDADTVRAGARRAIAAYLNVPVYAEFHRWLGRADDLTGMWEAWAAGDRRAALEAIPDRVVDELIVHGTPEECREHIDRYHANGVTTSAIAIHTYGGIDPLQAARDLSPAARR